MSFFDKVDAWKLYCEAFRALWPNSEKVSDAVSPAALQEMVDRLSARSAEVSMLDEHDEPLRKMLIDYRCAHPTHAENYFQKVVRWVRQQEVRSAHSATVECPECNVRFDPTWNRSPDRGVPPK